MLIPPPQRIHRRIAERLSPLPIFMQPEGGRPRRFTRLLLDEQRPDVVLVNNIAAFNGARYVRVQAQVAPELPTIAVVHEWRAIRAKGDARAGGALPGRPRRRSTTSPPSSSPPGTPATSAARSSACATRSGRS